MDFDIWCKNRSIGIDEPWLNVKSFSRCQFDAEELAGVDAFAKPNEQQPDEPGKNGFTDYSQAGYDLETRKSGLIIDFQAERFDLWVSDPKPLR